MSADHLWREVQRLQYENSLKDAQIAGLKAEIDYIKGIDKTQRQRYPPGASCQFCGQKDRRLRRWRCPACYMRWIRQQK